MYWRAAGRRIVALREGDYVVISATGDVEQRLPVYDDGQGHGELRHEVREGKLLSEQESGYMRIEKVVLEFMRPADDDPSVAAFVDRILGPPKPRG